MIFTNNEFVYTIICSFHSLSIETLIQSSMTVTYTLFSASAGVRSRVTFITSSVIPQIISYSYGYANTNNN